MQYEKHGKIEMTDQGLIIPALVVIVGQACSLKCKHCANFSPYAPNGTKRYTLEQIMSNLRLIFQSVCHIKKIQIQGGEPFLYTELAELLDFIHNSDPSTTLTIATNGTIIPAETVFHALKRNHVRVRISKYSVTPQENVSQLRDILDGFGIENWTYEFASQDSMWYNMGQGTLPFWGNVERRFLDCPFHDCFTLENGWISRCSRAIIAEQVQGFTANEDDYLRVEPSEDFSLRLWKYLEAEECMEACRYCRGTEGEKVVPAQQL